MVHGLWISCDAEQAIELQHRPPSACLTCCLFHPPTSSHPHLFHHIAAMDADLSKLSSSERSELMDKVKTQVLVANFQEMLSVSWK
jgi:hypothetical protein